MGYIINKNVEKCGLSSDEIDDIIDACAERAPYIRFGKKQKKKPGEDFISVETTKDLWKSKKTEVRANLIRIDDFWYGELYGEWLDFGERWICVTSPYRTKVFAAIALYYGLVKNKLRKTPTDNNDEGDYYDDDLLSTEEVEALTSVTTAQVKGIRFGKKQKKKPGDNFVSVEDSKDLWKSKNGKMKANLLRFDDYWYGELYADWADFGELWRTVTHPHRIKLFAAIALYRFILKHKLWKE